MATQITAWFTGSIDTHKLQMFDDFGTIGAELRQQPPPRSYGFGDRESVLLQGWPLWFAGHDCHIDGVRTEIHEICVSDLRREPAIALALPPFALQNTHALHVMPRTLMKVFFT